MNDNMNHVLNVTGVDIDGNALSGVAVRVLYEDEEIGRGTTRGRNMPFTLQFSGEYDYLTLEATFDSHKQTVNVPPGNLNYEFKFPVIPPQLPTHVPTWFPVAGFVTGAITLIFLMAVLVMGMFGHDVSQNGRFLVVIILAFGFAMSFSFVGGSAAANGRIPAFKQSPIRFSVGGGVAVFVIVLLLGWKIYLR
jgi:hypothetical protein